MQENTLLENDDLEILDDQEEEQLGNIDNWKIIVADDDAEVHRVTTLVLKDFNFDGKGLTILSAYSEKEVKELILNNPDTNVIFLDVIMDNEDSGLSLAKYIREDLKNRTIRIILRTGQPGQTPEEQTIINYDINDYKEKTELTSRKLITSLITALRTYQHIAELEHSKKALEETIVSTSEIFKSHRTDDFYGTLLKCLLSIVSACKSNSSEIISGLIATSLSDNEFYIVSGAGEFSNLTNSKLNSAIDYNTYNLAICSLRTNPCCFISNSAFINFNSELYPNILVYIKSRHNLSEMEKNLLSIFYSNVIVSLSNMYLLREIESTQKEILCTLGGIAEARSNELGQHVIRVAEFAKIIALGYGLSLDEAELIKQAAPMHDIGKIAILDGILNKPGKLTVDEFEVMKTHSQIGYDLLKSSSRKALKAAAIIALQHHEKYNGSGYPNKLKGEEIHLYGRIAAIADVFDALGCDRVYKKAWELDRILELFRQESGQHFDPVLVDILFKNLDKILHIKDSLRD